MSEREFADVYWTTRDGKLVLMKGMFPMKEQPETAPVAPQPDIFDSIIERFYGKNDSAVPAGLYEALIDLNIAAERRGRESVEAVLLEHVELEKSLAHAADRERNRHEAAQARIVALEAALLDADHVIYAIELAREPWTGVLMEKRDASINRHYAALAASDPRVAEPGGKP